jgi:histidyl-tRNA synthetase
MSQAIQAVRGMNDVLPGESEAWLGFEAVVEEWLAQYGYRNIRMPLVEPTQLFRRAIGEATDIVEKEMYSWRDELNDEQLTLRPEGTASCVRAAIEHSLLHDGPKRLWYSGPMYRHERPQKGRYRQFHQYGVEALGYAGPDVDAEHIVMCAALWRRLGLDGIRLELNNIGSAEERRQYRIELQKYLEKNIDRLDEDAKRRMRTNPLRALDSKNPMVKEVVASAPSLMGFLGEASLAHFDGLKKILNSQEIKFELNTKLVRGLDYYNLTVFEWISDKLGAQGTVCGGGRYDGLFAQLGGKPAPGAGFAMGNERLIALLQDAASGGRPASPHIYLVCRGAGAFEYGLAIAEMLRKAGYRVLQHAGEGSFKSQMSKANASGALCALIVGEDEVKENAVSMKLLREDIAQTTLRRDSVLLAVRNNVPLERQAGPWPST